MVAGGAQTSFVFGLFFFFFFPRLLSGSRAPNSNFNWIRTSFRPVSPAGSVGLFRTPAGAAVRHEPGSFPAASPVAGEMQRLRGEVRSAFPGARGWRLGSGQGGEDGGSGQWAPVCGWAWGRCPRDAETDPAWTSVPASAVGEGTEGCEKMGS